jgi:hypothetical protein
MTPNPPVERTVGSHSLAAAAHRKRYAYSGSVGVLSQLALAAAGDSIAMWTSVTTSIRKRIGHTCIGMEWSSEKSKRFCAGRSRIGQAGRDRGQTQAGRYLRVIYVPDPLPNSVFVITAYPLAPKALRALRRRTRRR